MTVFLLSALLHGCGSSPAVPSGTLLAAADVGEVPVTHVIDAATGQARQLVVDLPGRIYPAAADPKGTHALVIQSDEGPDGHLETLALVPLAGGAATKLAPPAQAVRHPSWSPDGQWLVFESSAESFRDLYKVRRDGTGLVRLTTAEHGSFEPSFSPDGTQIVFASSRDGNAEIYVMSADGTGVRRLTEYGRDDTSPQFTRDGQQVMWIRQVGASRVVHRVAATGGKAVALRLPDAPVVSHAIALDPTGRHAAIVEQTSARELQVVVVDLGDGHEVASLGGDGVDEMATWSPDGQWVVWSSQQSGDVELWRARFDGTSAEQLTHRVGPDWLPRWVK